MKRPKCPKCNKLHYEWDLCKPTKDQTIAALKQTIESQNDIILDLRNSKEHLTTRLIKLMDQMIEDKV